MDSHEFDQFVNAYSWRYAKTYAKKCPHEYYVRQKLPEAGRQQFAEAVQFIRDNGFEAYYFKRKGIYFIHGDHYYWEMEPHLPPDEVTILNRAALADYDRVDNTWVWKGTDSLR